MKLKCVAAAVLSVAASFGAQAGGTIGIGPLAIPSSWTVTGSLSGLGTILDSWIFTTAEPSDGNASASNTFVTLSGLGVLNQITNFSATLDGNPLTALPDFVTNLGGGNSITEQKLTIVPFTLGAGSHTLSISGMVGDGGGSYSATLALAPAPVPEPETLAMMLAGLGALGFLARRRQNG